MYVLVFIVWCPIILRQWQRVDLGGVCDQTYVWLLPMHPGTCLRSFFPPLLPCFFSLFWRTSLLFTFPLSLLCSALYFQFSYSILRNQYPATYNVHCARSNYLHLFLRCIYLVTLPGLGKWEIAMFSIKKNPDSLDNFQITAEPSKMN